MYSTPENVMDVMSYSIQRKILYIKFYARINLKRVYQKLVFMLNVSVVQQPIKFIIAWFHNWYMKNPVMW